MDETIAFLNQSEGRDKFCKVIQYGCRLLMFTQMGKNDKLALKFKGLFEGMRDSRKLFRLFKSLNEWKTIEKQIALYKADPTDTKILFNILSRGGFFFYWLFDNLSILAKIKFLDRVDKESASKKAATFWFIALVFAVIGVLIQMWETH